MEEKSWRFGAVGNIIATHTDADGNVYRGTKAFTPGTKVYINGKYWTAEQTEIGVIGMNRFGRTVVEFIPVDLIENVRAQRIYAPRVLEIIHGVENLDGWQWWNRTASDRKESEKFVKELKSRNRK